LEAPIKNKLKLLIQGHMSKLLTRIVEENSMKSDKSLGQIK